MPLFPKTSETSTGEAVLVDDARGRIVYTPGFVPDDVARAWFAELRLGAPWKAERRFMYDREVDVPRLQAHFRLAPPDGSVPDAIRVAAAKVVAVTGVPFNSVGLNFYRDGRDSVAAHSDDLDEIVGGCPIALLSLGATRRMTIRAKDAPRRALHVDLTAGSLLVMSYETQLYYTHGIPKTTQPVDARISLAFRVKPSPRARPRAAFRTPPAPSSSNTPSSGMNPKAGGGLTSRHHLHAARLQRAASAGRDPALANPGRRGALYQP